LVDGLQTDRSRAQVKRSPDLINQRRLISLNHSVFRKLQRELLPPCVGGRKRAARKFSSGLQTGSWELSWATIGFQWWSDAHWPTLRY